MTYPSYTYGHEYTYTLSISNHKETSGLEVDNPKLLTFSYIFIAGAFEALTNKSTKNALYL